MPSNIRKPGSGDLSATGYWSAGTAPATGEDLYFTSGKESYTAGLNLAAVDAQSINFGPEWGDDASVIGDGSSPLQIDLDRTGASTGLYFNGRCREANFAAGSTGTWTKATIAPINPTARINLSAASSGGTLVIESGLVTIGETFRPSTIRVYGGTVIIRAHSSNTPAIEVYGGRVICYRDWSSVTVYGGRFEYDLAPEGSTAYTGGTITLVGPTAEVLPLSGTCGTCIFRAGRINKSQARKALTLGSGGSTTYGPGATEIPARSGVTVTDTSRTNEGTGPKQAAA